MNTNTMQWIVVILTFLKIKGTQERSWASLVAQPGQETQVRSLGREEPLEKEMATHSYILACRGAWWIIVHGVTKSWARLSG